MTAAASRSRPDAAQRREAILHVAQDVFLEHGFEGASMSQVAARLGGSKGTLYSYFDSKEALFEALVAESCRHNADAMFAIPDDADIAARLLAFARGYIRLVNSDWAIRMFQAVAAEARRRPEIGRMFYDAGPGNALSRLAAWITAANAAGEIAGDDAPAAAETFAGLCRGSLHLKRMLALAPEPDDDTIDLLAQRAVQQFLQLHRNSR